MSVLPDFFLDLLKKYFVRNKDRFNNLMKTDPFIDLTGYYHDSAPINDKINIIYPQINIHEKAIQLITLLLDEVRNNGIDIYEEFRDKDIDFFEKYEPENLKNIYREKHRKILAINKLPQYLEFEDKFINDVTNICREIFSGDKSKIIDLNDLSQKMLSALANKKDNEIILLIIEIKNLYTSKKISQQLDTWLDQYGSLFVSSRLLESWRKRSYSHSSNTNKIESSLLIQIHDFTAKYLNLEAWFWSFNYPQKCYKILEKQEREYNELAEIIDNLLKVIDKEIPVKYKTKFLRVEFFLSRNFFIQEKELLIQGLQYGENETNLCYKYPVVFRLGERLQDNTVRGEWENLWQQICSNSRNINQLIPESLFKVSNECEKIKYKFNDDGNICLGLKPLAPTDYSKILGSISSRGTPIFIWSRHSFQEINNNRCLTRIREILRGVNDLQTLPRIIREQRRIAYDKDDEAHIGQHLCLLWDDPERVPMIQKKDIKDDPERVPMIQKKDIKDDFLFQPL